jgi:hypothetical protein
MKLMHIFLGTRFYFCATARLTIKTWARLFQVILLIFVDSLSGKSKILLFTDCVLIRVVL